MSQCWKITPNVVFDFFQLCHFPSIFVIIKLACLVTLFDRQLQVFPTPPNGLFWAFGRKFWPLKNVNRARFARHVEWYFFGEIQTLWSVVIRRRWGRRHQSCCCCRYAARGRRKTMEWDKWWKMLRRIFPSTHSPHPSWRKQASMSTKKEKKWQQTELNKNTHMVGKSPKWAIFGHFNAFLPTLMVKVAHLDRHVEWDFWGDFPILWMGGKLPIYMF